MSYSSTFAATGEKNSLAVEFIGGALILDISLQDDLGKREQHVRIPLSDFDYPDLCMFSSYIHANIQSLQYDFMELAEAENNDDMSGEGPENETL